MTTKNGNRYLFVITSYDQEPDRTAAPLVLANNALAAGGDVLVWLTHDGVELVKNGAAAAAKPRSFPTFSELLDNYRENGGRLGVCPPCGKSHGVTDTDLPANASWMGAQALLAEMEGRQSLAF